MHEAVSFFTGRAAEQLRNDGSWTRQITVFIQSSPFARAETRYSSCGIEPLTATQDTRDSGQCGRRHTDPNLQTRHRLCEGGRDAFVNDRWH
uniref:DinB/UmuC family translesion DNA polymerase n=1 Tax=Escherichia coli TaxID=562 RepID=UPI001F278AF5|nr:hypothetical protein [Escherichia coli]